jgi:hypothetical protein
MCRCVRVWRASAARTGVQRGDARYAIVGSIRFVIRPIPPNELIELIRPIKSWCSLKGRCCVVVPPKQGEEQEWPHSRSARARKAHLNSLHTRLSLSQTTSLLFQFAILI